MKGVQKGAQPCTCDCTLPIALRNSEGNTVTFGSLVTRTISGSEIPGLLGLSSLREDRTILDCTTIQFLFCCPGDNDLQKALPPRSDSFQFELARSGHLVLP